VIDIYNPLGHRISLWVDGQRFYGAGLDYKKQIERIPLTLKLGNSSFRSKGKIQQVLHLSNDDDEDRIEDDDDNDEEDENEQA
jgi:hypothetical protein